MMNQIIQLLSLVGNMGEHVETFRHMTKWQWIQLGGYVLAGAATAMALDPTNYLAIVLGALTGMAAHLVPLMQTLPADRKKSSRLTLVKVPSTADRGQL